jgi:DNA-directed RNA polymerase specialized sigma24 family protein
MSRCEMWAPTPEQWDRLVRVAKSRGSDLYDPAFTPEDVVQEALLRLAGWLERGHEMSGGDDGHMRFLATTIHHLLVDIVRRRSRLIGSGGDERPLEDRRSARSNEDGRRIDARLELNELRVLDPRAFATMVAYVQHAPERPSTKHAYLARKRLRATLAPDDPRRAKLR